MANTYTGIIPTLVANRVLKAFAAKMAPIRAFSTNLSPDPGSKGQAITTSLIAQKSAGAVSGDYGALASDSTDTTITVTMNQHYGQGFHITDVEATQIAANVFPDQLQRRIEMTVTGVTKQFWQAVLSVVTNANYSTAAFVGAAGTFDADAVVDLRTTANNNDWPDDRAIVLDPDYVGALLKDNAIQGASNWNAEQRGGMIGRISGFDLYESNNIPANSENLQGFICVPDCMAVAMRVVTPQATEDMIDFQALTDPATGASCGFRVWYDRNSGQVRYTVDILYGYAKANTAGLKRITSA